MKFTGFDMLPLSLELQLPPNQIRINETLISKILIQCLFKSYFQVFQIENDINEELISKFSIKC